MHSQVDYSVIHSSQEMEKKKKKKNTTKGEVIDE